ncbi:MAG TPA: zinc ABC transporter substrate-binding protein [Chromatiales bacterium]|nr:zinc ABC transporter substrate-binding protein [Chromatiales bacterium]
MKTFILALLSLALLGCEPDIPRDSAADAEPDTRPVAYAMNYPLAWMAQRLAGDAIRVELPVPDELDPADWMPGADDLLKLRQADLILLNGAGYSIWVSRAGLPNHLLIDTSRNIRDRLIRFDDPARQQAAEGAGGHGDWAFTIWLDPTLAIEQAAAIRDAFVNLMPDRHAEFEVRFSRLELDLQQLDTRLEQAFAPFSGQPVLFSRPVYQYLQRRYGLDGLAVNWRPRQLLGPEDLEMLEMLRLSHPAKVMFWEDYLLQVTVDQLEAIGVKSVVFRTGASRPESGDYLSLMQENLDNLAHFRPAGPREDNGIDGDDGEA